MDSYAQHLQGESAKPGWFHKAPYYLNPLSLKSFDTASVRQLVLKTNSFWHMISPMRQASINVSLQEKVKFMSAKKLTDISAISLQPPSKVVPRELNVQGEFGDISLEDEQALWHNPDLIPNPLKAKVVTHVWLAKLDEEKRKNILAKVSATDLARCWVGPEEVLIKLKECIAEKKWNLVVGYLKSVKPSRKHPAFVRMSQEAVQYYLQEVNSADELSKAS
jgi:hypothetical protein